MRISDEEVKHIAKLAKLKLNEEQVSKMAEELGSIKEFIEQLNEVDTSSVSATAHILDIKNVFRKDERTGSFDREEILANAPRKDAGCFVVPKVVE